MYICFHSEHNRKHHDMNEDYYVFKQNYIIRFERHKVEKLEADKLKKSMLKINLRLIFA